MIAPNSAYRTAAMLLNLPPLTAWSRHPSCQHRSSPTALRSSLIAPSSTNRHVRTAHRTTDA
eukprot:1636796-Rhodomonas_salina.1